MLYAGCALRAEIRAQHVALAVEVWGKDKNRKSKRLVWSTGLSKDMCKVCFGLMVHEEMNNICSREVDQSAGS